MSQSYLSLRQDSIAIFIVTLTGHHQLCLQRSTKAEYFGYMITCFGSMSTMPVGLDLTITICKTSFGNQPKRKGIEYYIYIKLIKRSIFSYSISSISWIGYSPWATSTIHHGHFLSYSKNVRSVILDSFPNVLTYIKYSLHCVLIKSGIHSYCLRVFQCIF
jgi:hypothetical protein